MKRGGLSLAYTAARRAFETKIAHRGGRAGTVGRCGFNAELERRGGSSFKGTETSRHTAAGNDRPRGSGGDQLNAETRGRGGKRGALATVSVAGWKGKPEGGFEMGGQREVPTAGLAAGWQAEACPTLVQRRIRWLRQGFRRETRRPQGIVEERPGMRLGRTCRHTRFEGPRGTRRRSRVAAGPHGRARVP